MVYILFLCFPWISFLVEFFVKAVLKKTKVVLEKVVFLAQKAMESCRILLSSFPGQPDMT